MQSISSDVEQLHQHKPQQTLVVTTCMLRIQIKMLFQFNKLFQYPKRDTSNGTWLCQRLLKMSRFHATRLAIHWGIIQQHSKQLQPLWFMQACIHISRLHTFMLTESSDLSWSPQDCSSVNIIATSPSANLHNIQVMLHKPSSKVKMLCSLCLTRRIAADCPKSTH